jgi:hypothetical protein
MKTNHPVQQKIVTYTGNLLLMLQITLVFLWALHEKISIPSLFLWTGRTHPLFVHFPIAVATMLLLAWFFRPLLGEHLFKTDFFHNLLLASALFATLTAISGYLLSSSGDYDESLLSRHRNLGTLTAVSSYLLWLIYPRTSVPLFSAAMGIAGVVMIIASHFGGSLTHGEHYLFPDTPTSPLTREAPTDSTPIFEASIQPILESKCHSCHNEKKSKGGLVMTTLEGLLKGGKNGAPWIPGDPVKSLLVQRLLLDLGDKKHMPPKGKPQLSEADIQLIRYWIHRGAKQDIAFRDLPDQDSLRQLAAATIGQYYNKNTAAKTYDLPAYDPAAVARLQSPYRNLQPVYQESPALELSFFLKQGFSPAMIGECEPVRNNIVSLSLSNMPVNDSVIPMLARFPNLEVLNLSGTEVTGKGLYSLAGLKKLRSLSLSNTKVSADGLRALTVIPSLEKVFLWQTSVDERNLTALRQMMPRVLWDAGSPVDAREKLRLTPPQLSDPEKFIFASNEHLSFYHPLKGAQVRFTDDGSDPDSLRSATYSGPIPIKSPATFRAIAVMDGWYASEVKEFSVFPVGLKPLEATFLSNPDPKYSLQGAESLFDNQKGEINNLLVNWIGYREGPMTLRLRLDGQKIIRSVVISAGINHAAYVFPPLEIVVKAGMSDGRWKQIQSIRPAQPNSNGPQKNMAFTVTLEPAAYQHLEIIVKPVRALPAWHGGKNQKGWIFVDEVFIY